MRLSRSCVLSRADFLFGTSLVRRVGVSIILHRCIIEACIFYYLSHGFVLHVISYFHEKLSPGLSFVEAGVY